MNRELNQAPHRSVFTLTLMVMAIMGLALSGCSENSPTQPNQDTSEPEMGVFRVNEVGNSSVGFEFMSTQHEEPGEPSEGPFAIRGSNIRWEDGMLKVDLTVTNIGDETYDEGVTMTFLSMLPDGLTIHHPDNGENGNGAAINFEFANDDAQWIPGEESLPRETHFLVEAGISIGFVARLDTGTGGHAMGSVGGMVWDDANGDGIMDEGESGVEGTMIELSAEGMEPMTTLSAADGTYSFDDLVSGFYTVVKMPSEESSSTTSPRIFVLLAEDEGMVSSFLAANFGCMMTGGGDPTGVIRGIAFNDLNGNGDIDEGEAGIAGLTVDLSGDKIATTTTDADGYFSFTEVGRGVYSLLNTGNVGWTSTTGNQAEVILDSDDSVYNETRFGWQEDEIGDAMGIIKGIVWNDINGDGIKNEDEPGMVGAPLLLTGDAAATVKTNADGVFNFTELAAGDYTVLSTGPLGWVATTATKADVTLDSNDSEFNEVGFGWQED